ncbi:acyltransferase family protein [Candidatus Pelagibacter sp. HIMB1321]|uniref:acyltransferase family protein n=1 Tax=Candidatus Pelagibacter sp. HIMB1321 TaxID=1388755 RepID=UPI000A07E253|nr:acyltransferase family protein [Candidatus Pelagibacter sp. HIMB1321]SMF79483.1 Peptidoglycan/LPS O-acetylase OafA/YrhL, contains acyltransferase and SGNH-hydrolase domains [Candidatus Pelagibacter sp. HIMB1321]
MKYRSEIDGLRALAVIPVIFYHAGFELFKGGFVGVDVFFVISGYLITSIILDEMRNKEFSLINFYERRARRILPALFFVMLVSIFFAWNWMQPMQMKNFSQSLVAVSIFSSNILFWLETGYFEEISEEKPLLHTWSLAVEEQYYLFFPILLLFIWKFGRKKIISIFLTILITSLFLSEYTSRFYKEANFYLAPFRIWEIFFGSITAVMTKDKIIRDNNLLSTIGLIAILFSIFFFDETIRFPSFYTLFPVLGSVLIIIFANNNKGFVTKFLRIKLIVGIGLVSYSAYLWQQPIFAFVKIRFLDEPSKFIMFLLSIFTLLIATFSWKYIEKPFRQNKNSPISKKNFILFSIIGIFFFTTLGLYGHFQKGNIVKYQISPTITETIVRSNKQSECFGKDFIHKRDDWYCIIGDKTIKPSLVVFGDSHALSFLPTIDTSLQQLGESAYFIATHACPPLLNIHSFHDNQSLRNCNKLNERVLNFIKVNDIKNIFLVARWTYYTDGGYDGNDFSYIALENKNIKNKDVSRNAFKVGIEKTLASYKKLGVKLTVITQIPQQKHKALDLYFESLRSGDSVQNISLKRSDHDNLQNFVSSIFENKNIDLLDFTDIFCTSEICAVGDELNSLYYDDDHLSLSGSELIVKPTINYLKSNIYSK